MKAFKFFFVLFISLVFIGTIILRWKLNIPLMFAIYEIIALFFFSTSLDYPFNDILLQFVWLLFPFFGLVLLADGLSSIGNALKYGDHKTLEWNREMAGLMEDHIIIIGIGNVGLRLLKELNDREIVAIDEDDNKGRDDEFLEFQKIHHIPLIRGNARRSRVLEEAGIAKAKILILAIDNDLLNIKIAMIAKKLNPSIKTIIRMFDLDFGNEIKEKLGIDTIISTSSVSVPHFIKAIDNQ